MNLESLFSFQQEIDKELLYKLNQKDKSLVPQKILALHIKIGELANATNCSKYWSKETTSNKDLVLEKYVECLHFIATIGIERNFTEYEIQFKGSDSNITDQFLNLYIDLNDFIVSSSKDSYITLIEDFLGLSLTLGISEQEIIKGYRNIYL